MTVGLAISDRHKRSKMSFCCRVQSCAYDTIGWGVEFGYTLDGQPIRTPYNSYFTGDLLCSNPGGCSCPSSAVGHILQGTEQRTIKRLLCAASSIRPTVAESSLSSSHLPASVQTILDRVSALRKGLS